MRGGARPRPRRCADLATETLCRSVGRTRPPPPCPRPRDGSSNNDGDERRAAIAQQQHGGDQGGTEKVARHGTFLLSAPPAPEGLAEVRSVRPAAVPRPILSQELLDISALLARGGILERFGELRSSFLHDAEPE